MIIDGRQIAEEIKAALKEEAFSRAELPQLVIITVGEDPAVETFLDAKKRFARALGVETSTVRFRADESAFALVEEVKAVSRAKNRGIIVQLPLPARISTQAILDAVPVRADVDVLSSAAFGRFEEGLSLVLPPVVGAIAEVLARCGVSPRGKRATVIGRGLLVGKPAAVWLRRQGAEVEVVDRQTPDIGAYTADADIIVSGAGSPGIITPDIINEGAVLLDAGTGELEGEVRGDADPACAEKASIFTPTPGGIGPLTVAVLFRNLFVLAR